jgi:hypothetical protein
MERQEVATTVLPLRTTDSSSAVAATTRPSPSESVIPLRDFAAVLYARMSKTDATELEDVRAAVRRLRTSFNHLLAESEDPESILNSLTHGMTYSRQLKCIVEDADFALRGLDNLLLARLDGRNSLTSHKIALWKGDLAALKVRIDVFLDSAQLYDRRRVRGESSATENALDNIKGKVDKIAARVFSRRSSTADGNTTADELWQLFYAELLNEGFSKPILDRNKVSWP